MCAYCLCVFYERTVSNCSKLCMSTLCVSVSARVRLSKRRKLGNVPVNKSRLIVKHRAMLEAEVQQQEARLTALEPAQDEEEEEMQLDVVEGQCQHRRIPGHMSPRSCCSSRGLAVIALLSSR